MRLRNWWRYFANGKGRSRCGNQECSQHGIHEEKRLFFYDQSQYVYENKGALLQNR